MKFNFYYLFFLLISSVFYSCGGDNDPVNPPVNPATLTIKNIKVGNIENKEVFNDTPTQDLKITLTFSSKLDKSTLEKSIFLSDTQSTAIRIDYDGDKTVIITPSTRLNYYKQYTLSIGISLLSADGSRLVAGKSYKLNTELDPADKFKRISDEDLLNLIQNQTFKYFWDFAHPVSGMARERSTSGDVVTTGGTGFGVMAIIVASERGFISRHEAASRVLKIVNFLDQKCTSYHGAYAHWINGSTGETQPFSQSDNGADLVETALLFQGLLSSRAYFSENNATETQLREIITRLWENVEWTWFQKNNENALYWHWSPNLGWQINMQISGWNESLITYVLAASSPSYPISKTVYDEGWARKGAIRNGASHYGIKLPLGPEYGGPLFFSHYSFLGINPKGLKDAYADYWEQNVNHSLINYNYCKQNPAGYWYPEDCWGLTASDGNNGYSAHSPTNDKGVIAPTAALSSMPYTPEQSLAALHFFYYKLGDKLWSDYGFYDAFNLSDFWFDNQSIAIDQGPIVVMIENYRSGLLWNTFMNIPEIKSGLKKLGFESPNL